MARVFIVGDSHSATLGPFLFESGQALGWEPAGRISNVGWSTGRYRNESEWKARIAEAHPDMVIVILGTNDAAQGQQAYVEQLRAVVDAIRASGARSIVWIGPPSAKNPQIDARADRIAPWQGSFLPQMGVQWIDSRLYTFGGHAPDGVHFTRAGYRAWAAALMDDRRGSPRLPQKASGDLGGSVLPWSILAVVALWVSVNWRKSP
jgi:lysophospholipase L1-like esterase